MSEYKIPRHPIISAEGKPSQVPEPKPEDTLIFEPNEGEKVMVFSWVRYPSYDFIFGVPHKDSPKYKEEVGFFLYRDARNGIYKEGLYLDVQELLELIDGFGAILQESQKNSQSLWFTHLNKTK